MNKAAIIVIGLIIVGGIIFTLMRPDPANNTNTQGMGAVQAPLYDSVSAQVGTATFTDEAGKTKVVVALSQTDTAAYSAEIRAGTCSTVGGIRYSLKQLANGRSETVLAPAMHFIHGLGDSALVITKLNAEATVKSICGNLKGPFDQVMGTITQ
jgi:hypothetical protein